MRDRGENSRPSFVTPRKFSNRPDRVEKVCLFVIERALRCSETQSRLYSSYSGAHGRMVGLKEIYSTLIVTKVSFH